MFYIKEYPATMCLAVPMKIISKHDSEAVAEMEGVNRQINLMMLPDAEINDYVIVHAGFAIEKLDEEEALKRITLIRQISALKD
jgi:hydrogenase expression/formation protein HypC